MMALPKYQQKGFYRAILYRVFDYSFSNYNILLQEETSPYFTESNSNRLHELLVYTIMENIVDRTCNLRSSFFIDYLSE